MGLMTHADTRMSWRVRSMLWHYELKDAHVVVRLSLTGLKAAAFSARKQAIKSGCADMLATLPAVGARLEDAAVAARSRIWYAIKTIVN